jgi:hypothetical protein
MTRTAGAALVIFLVLVFSPCASAQQHGQYVPGMMGLNAGVTPDPGFTYENLTINYSSDSLKDADGSSIPVKGNYSIWPAENLLSFVPNARVLGGHYFAMVLISAVDGSLTVPEFGVDYGGYGLADLLVQPVNFGWHFQRVDTLAGYGFMAPTGRYTAGATDNVGSGYWGHHFMTGNTVYLPKNKGTTANLFTDWEVHQQKAGTADFRPGQAFTDEWGVGQIIPLDKQQKKLAQFGVIGYDQWQVTANGGAGGGVLGLLPYYSVHAAGVQGNFIVPARALTFFFKYEPEYRALAHSSGRTIVFGGAWTLGNPSLSGKP